ncbi:MAG TPA: methyltransferase domain-containing protein [Candidatus Saccharimonadia bacterium]|jgi:SAM-dependent methyltransferase
MSPEAPSPEPSPEDSRPHEPLPEPLAEPSPKSPEQLDDKFVYLEYGPGLTPSAPREANPFTGNRHYIGIDIGSDSSTIDGRNYGEAASDALPVFQRRVNEAVQRRTVMEFIKRAPKPGKENIQFMRGNARTLPLPDQSVDEIYMSNVLTAPQSPDEQLQLLAEAIRVLKPNGEIVVKCNWDRDLWPPETVEELLRSAGLRIDERVDSTNSTEEWFAYSGAEIRFGNRDLKKGGYFFRASRPRAAERAKWTDDERVRWLSADFRPSIGRYGAEGQTDPDEN